MGRLEAESRERTRKNELRRLVLESVKVAGVVALFLVAPNVVGAMARLGMIPSRRQNDVVLRSCDRLIRAGLLTKNAEGMIRLTPKGESTLQMLHAKEAALRKPRKWDKKWRVLVFDIPNYRRGLRDKVRNTLKSIGFVQLQASVWVYPFDCEDLVTLLKAELRVGKDLLYMIVDSIENDRALRHTFQLNVR